MCRKQATLIAKWEGHAYHQLEHTVAARTGQQLFFANMERFRGHSPSPNQAPATMNCPADPPALAAVRRPGPQAAQLTLRDPPRDPRRASSLTPPHDPALLQALLHHADALAERHGWTWVTQRQVRYGLKLLASCHEPGEPIKTSTVQALSPLQIPPRRMLEVLTTAETPMVCDRPDALTLLIDTHFTSLPPQIREELQAWIQVLRHGSARRRARPESTVRGQLACVRPFLGEVATRYYTLREVTADDVTNWLDGCTRPSDHLSALRDLFRTLKTQRLVFANPTSHIHRSRPHVPAPSPLDPQALRHIGQAAEHDPALRVVLALIGVHALWPKQVRHLLLDDIDLPNRQFRFGGASRPLDPFTAAAIIDYLTYRRERWPHTSNPHLLVSPISANDHAPVCHPWIAKRFQALPVTPTQLRQDRILEEARATHADPLHLTAMFGFSAETGLRYAGVMTPELTTPGP